MREEPATAVDAAAERAARSAQFKRVGQFFDAVTIKRQEQLFDAVEAGDVRLLRALKPDVNEILTPNKQGVHALRMAAINNSQAVLHYFYNVAACYYYEFDVPAGQTQKPLQTYGYQLHHWIIYTAKNELILRHTLDTLKPDLRAKTRAGETALSIALEFNNEVAVDVLRSMGIVELKRRAR